MLVAALVKGERALGAGRGIDKVLVERAGLTAEEARMVVNNFAANFFHRQTLYLSRLTDEERDTLDRQIPLMFSSGLAGLWFENMGFGGFDPSFVAHVQRIMSNSRSAPAQGK